MYGLVFSGGGAKGAYQVGVWKALNELEIEASCVCGTSVGALNGAFYAQRKYEEAYEMWSNISMDSVFDGDHELFKGIDHVFKEGKIQSSLKLIEQAYKNVVGHKGMDITPLRQIIDAHLDENVLRNSGIDFGFVTLSLNDRKVLRLFASDIDQGNLKYYLMGSAMVPGFTQDKDFSIKFADGGLVDNFPVKMVYDKGYRKIIAVNLFTKKFKGYKDAEVIYIRPHSSLGNFLYFEKDRALDNIELGYLDALKAFDKLEGFEYYFYNTYTEEEVVDSIHNMKLEEKSMLCELVLHKELLHERMFYEKVLPKMFSQLGLKQEHSYKDLITKAFEKVLRESDIKQVQKIDFKKQLEATEFEEELQSYNVLLSCLR